MTDRHSNNPGVTRRPLGLSGNMDACSRRYTKKRERGWGEERVWRAAELGGRRITALLLCYQDNKHQTIAP